MTATSPGYRPCPAEKARTRLATYGPWSVDPGRFHSLHEDGAKLIRGWIDQAAKSAPGNEFEAFIYAWIGFNGWATCCCEEDGDTLQRYMLILDERVTRKFDRLTAHSSVGAAAERFASLWPIFRVSDLPEPVRRSRPRDDNRAAVVGHYQEKRPEAVRAPDCHLNHASAVEPDWAHTLEALYRVRCNLFHGQKSGAGYEDRAIVVAAVDVLLPVAASVLALR